MFTDSRILDLTEKEYFALDAVSNSTLTKMQKDPAGTHDKIKGNDAMKLGSAFDQFLLEPERFEREWTVIGAHHKSPSGENQSKFAKLVIAGEDCVDAYAQVYAKPSTEKAEALNDSLQDYFKLKMIPNTLTALQKWTLDAMKASVMGHARAKEIVDYAVAEGATQTCYIGTHEETGLRVKGMLDIGSGPVFDECDIKTTSSPWYEVTGRYWFEKRGYDTQRAMYGGLLASAGGITRNLKQGLMVVRTEGRHECRVFDVTSRLLDDLWRGGATTEDADEKLNRLLKEYAWRDRTGNWERHTGFYKGNGVEVL